MRVLNILYVSNQKAASVKAPDFLIITCPQWLSS